MEDRSDRPMSWVEPGIVKWSGSNNQIELLVRWNERTEIKTIEGVQVTEYIYDSFRFVYNLSDEIYPDEAILAYLERSKDSILQLAQNLSQQIEGALKWQRR